MEKKALAQLHGKLFTLSIILGITGLAAYAASKFIPGKTVVIITALGLLGFIITLCLLALQKKGIKRTIRDISLSLLAIVAGTYLLLFAFVFFFQDWVANRTSSFFQPKSISAEAAQALVTPGVIELDLIAPDETHLRGWLVRNSTEPETPLMIYFGGSGSESSELISYVRQLDGWSAALVNYRGFGQSDGTPTQANALADALFIYDTLAKREDIDAIHIVAMGYSLGTGVAVSLAAQRPVVGTILVSPYDHWSLIGVNPSPIYAPLAGIMKPYFNSAGLAPAIQTPLLCLIGAQDPFIPPALSHTLADAWAGETIVIEYPGEDHSLLFHANSNWIDIRAFLDRIQ
jgi:hypothetical protein